ncbi:hypothetical protein D7316_01737 [Gordonia insulae]|uniref:Uncharacterized protein n=1 Tax=Gordonia insulae TaxID=2420509 RepID=A0A3G8JJF9_9ACTN|nr:hypothetical protein D7316_01737 [Gordonia insulae]
MPLSPMSNATMGPPCGILVFQLLVARISAPIFSFGTPELRMARSAAAAAIERADSSPLIQRRFRMPLRSKIHSSVESRTWRTSSLLTSRVGRYAPMPSIATFWCPVRAAIPTTVLRFVDDRPTVIVGVHYREVRSLWSHCRRTTSAPVAGSITRTAARRPGSPASRRRANRTSPVHRGASNRRTDTRPVPSRSCWRGWRWGSAPMPPRRHTRA